MRRGREARRRAGRQATWLRVTAAASSATLLGTLGLAGTSMAAAGAAARRREARGTRRHRQHVVPPGQRRQARGGAHLRQRALLPRQPECPVRPAADAEPAELLQAQRHVPVQQPHPADRAHRRRHPDHAHRPVRRPAGHADLEQLPGLQRRRPERQLQHDRPGGLVRVLDRPGLRHQDAAERRARHQPEHGLLAGAAGHRGAPRRAEHHHPGALGAVHPGRLQRRRGGHGQPGAREHRGRHPQGVRRRVAGRPAAERRHRTRSRTRRPPTTSASACTAPRAARSAPTPRGSSSARPARRRPRSPTCCRTSRAGTTGSRRCSATGTSRRSSARVPRTCPHHGYQVTNAAGNLVDENGNQINGAFLTNHPGFPGFGPINASQTLAYMADMLESGVPVVNGYIADIHGNEHIPGVTACNGAPAGARQRHRVLHRAGEVLQRRVRHLLPAAGRRRHHARRTRRSSSARTRATTWPAPTWAGPSSPPRPTATA